MQKDSIELNDAAELHGDSMFIEEMRIYVVCICEAIF